MIGKDLVETHGEQLRSASGLAAAVREGIEILALGERERVAETEGHADRRHGVEMPGRIADEDAFRTPVRHARPNLVGRGVDPARTDRFDECGPECRRQDVSVGVGQERLAAAGLPAVQRDIDDDPDAVFAEAVHEDLPGSAKQHVSVAFQRQRRAGYRHPYHARARHPACGQPQRLTHDRGAAVRAHDACGCHESVPAVAGRKGDAPVLNRAYSHVGHEFRP